MSLEAGSVIDDKYRVVRLIGEGGMGAVYLGENVRIKRQVAIKILHAKVASNAEVVQRFEREAQAAGTIGNDHILEVLDLGSLSNGDRYIVMEFLEGEPLAQRMERLKRLSPVQIIPIVSQLLEGLAAAHKAGITHRDLKPDNVFLLRKKAGQRDFVKIIDFGISKFAQAENGIKMTQAGVIMGTPLYMSPEQARSSEADARSDLYSVGVIMYEAASGRVPFTGEAFNELLIQIVLGEVTPLHVAAPDVEPTFSGIVMKAMAREPRDRFQSAEDLRAALEEWRVTFGGGIRTSSIPPTMAMGQTPVPGQQPLTQSRAAWTPAPGQGGTPYPGGQGTPYPNNPGTPYPAQHGTPYPVQGGPQTPYPGGPRTPTMSLSEAQGSSHAWGASQAGLHPGMPPAARNNKSVVIAAGAGVTLVLGLAIFGITRMSHNTSAPPPVAAAGSPAPAQPPSATPVEVHPQAVLAPAPTVSSLPAKEEPAATPSAAAATPAAAAAAPAAAAHAHGAPPATTPAPAAAKPTTKDAKPAAAKPGGKSEPDFGY